ncbi:MULTISPECIES: hypothetical protein [unclassified Gordonia (in: high G+C Gram-positive bacteria)]|uniref:hypothetical protein n=1 Tax=unclassified Gordonia (in: high G+C Gram-positive bacteria) TaxID=2657482 RepID=UPI001F0FC911|nr:hypothetical protein [Gordonia sp. ABSL49_1]MCH5642451.1 hypothetical protein [Gordonia sp. ABSL49_1]
MTHPTPATTLITQITHTACAARTAPATSDEAVALASSVSDLVAAARVSGLPDAAIDAALRGARADAVSALPTHTYRVVAVEDSVGARHYEVRSTVDDERVVGFYSPDIARDAARILNTGMCPESWLPAGDRLR